MAKTKVTFVQSRTGAVNKVKVNDQEFAVLSAMPTLINGQLAVTMTIAGADLAAETDDSDEGDDATPGFGPASAAAPRKK